MNRNQKRKKIIDIVKISEDPSGITLEDLTDQASGFESDVGSIINELISEGILKKQKGNKITKAVGGVYRG